MTARVLAYRSEKQHMTSNSSPTNYSIPVRQIARLVQSLNRRQKARLLQLVPELQTIQPEEAGISAEQESLIAYFESKYPELNEPEPLQGDELFFGDLTVAEFFALPEEEQAHIWQGAYAEAEHEIGTVERTVRPDALPAR
jgi:hypothetical protein